MDAPIRPTVADITGDNVYANLAREVWLAKTKPITRVQQDVLNDRLWEPLRKDNFSSHSLILLENLQVFERYLWPTFNENSTNIHVFLIALLINIKKRENLPTWSLFVDKPAEFSILFRRMLSLVLDTTVEIQIRTVLLVSIIGAFQSLDSGLIRKECAPLVSISIWHHLHSEHERQRRLEANPRFKKAWRVAIKRYDGADEPVKTRLRFERSWLYTLVLDFLDRLYNESSQGSQDRLYCEYFLEFITDLQSQFPTRRYVNTLLQDLNLLVAVKLSPLYRNSDGALIRDLFHLLRHYTLFPLDDHKGEQFSIAEVSAQHLDKLAQLQRIAMKHFKDQLKLLALSNYGSLEQREELKDLLEPLSTEALAALTNLLGYRTTYEQPCRLECNRDYLIELLLFTHERNPSYQESVRSTSLLPTERTLYDPSFLRNDTFNGTSPLAIPKLNLQYLATSDFLWRSFILSRCEAFYEIRKSMEEVVKRLRPRLDNTTGNVRYDGSSRMALEIAQPAIIEVVPSKVGENIPAEVRAEIILDVSRLTEFVRKEWESLKPDDVVFLLGVHPRNEERKFINGHSNELEKSSAPFEILRAAEIIQVQDDKGRSVRAEMNNSNGHFRRPRQRRLLVRLDAAAYHKDISNASKESEDIYKGINLVVRRSSRENNFKPILESIQRLTLSDAPLPSWLQDVFLGLGDPSGATYKQLPSAMESLDYRDTFLSWEHLQEAYSKEILQTDGNPGDTIQPPYILTSIKASKHAEETLPAKRRRGEAGEIVKRNDSSELPIRSVNDTVPTDSRPSKKRRRDAEDETPRQDIMKVSTYKPPNIGPYLANVPKTNSVRFTTTQVEAITSGTQPGLTVIVGPPGTGKTDVATQIISNIYHNFPQERTLLVAHSNQALNQLFQKIVALDIDERHLLRLGHGEGELVLETDANYSKTGRVESFLENGTRLLQEVNRLAASFNAPGAHGNSCETADYFNLVYVKPAWVRYNDLIKSSEASLDDLRASFPFHGYFSNAPQPLFPDTAGREEILEIVMGCYRHIEKIFSELEDIRPFEILRNSRDKANYLLVKEAKIIAMTSTHAAMRRQEIANLGFRYDNVIMEEAAQITEIENFIPMALQNPKDGAIGLKRVVLCGDHYQNSPIIQNLAFRQYANLEQSLFLRLVRLGVPTIVLDKQGRARPSLADLYKWRYPSLGNLPNVTTSQEYLTANAGLRYECQFIDVPDYKGKGESEPSPHFIQNLGEAEYAVALYQYMRLLGYPASKISILTTYAGQRALIKDVLHHRCAKNRLFGLPRTVTTADKYQGEQNDYVILSLVRTKRVGYLRDIRRLTVALSRARLGLYVFGRREVFEASYELKEAFDRLFKRPDKLQLTTGEMFPTTRTIEADVSTAEMTGVEHLGQYVFEMTQAKIASLKAGTEILPPVEQHEVIAADEEDDNQPVFEEGNDAEVDEEDEEG